MRRAKEGFTVLELTQRDPGRRMMASVKPGGGSRPWQRRVREFPGQRGESIEGVMDLAILDCVGVLGSVHTRTATRRDVPAALAEHLWRRGIDVAVTGSRTVRVSATLPAEVPTMRARRSECPGMPERATSDAMRRLIATLLLIAALDGRGLVAQPQTLPNRPDSLKFAVIGDNGTGDQAEYDVAARMIAAHNSFPFDMVMMLGDNLYGRQQPDDFIQKFARPYAPLLETGVRFYAALGNHDRQENRGYEPFNMGGQRYYTFARHNVRFFVLDSNYLDPPQLVWIEAALKSATEDWRICYFHHPLYSDGKTHGS
jgi:hypothetical protein